MKKKGFTLVELLAVIAILAILVIIALPNVMGMFNQAKKNSFITEVQDIYNAAVQQRIADSLGSTKQNVYCRLETDATKLSEPDVQGITDSGSVKELDLSGRKGLRYCIMFNKAGEVTTYVATDGSYIFGWVSTDGLEIDAIEDGGTVTTEPAYTDGKVYTISDFTGKLDGKITTSGTISTSSANATIVTTPTTP